MKAKLAILLRKIISQQANRDEVKELNVLLQNTDKNVAYKSLEELWEKYDVNVDNFELEIQAVKKEIDKTISSENIRQLKFRRSIGIIWKVAAVSLALIASNYLFDWGSLFSSNEKFISVVTKPGESAMVELPDGSKVKLNSASKLTYSSEFNKRNRSVMLEGEAFFDIRKSKTDKFVVHTSQHNVEVMGTTFNVFSYKTERAFNVTLLTGKVKVLKAEDNSEIAIMKPNEKFVYDRRTSKYVLSNTDTALETAWMRGEIIFRNEPLKLVITRLERFYGVDISTIGDIQNIDKEVLTGRFEKGDIDDVLTVLSQLYPIRCTKINTHVTLSARR